MGTGGQLAESPVAGARSPYSDEDGSRVRAARGGATRGCPLPAFVDGITLRIRDDRAFVPDAVVVCPPPPDAVEIDNPRIVVEVLSPLTAALDHGVKLESYFSLASLAHYLILDPDRRVVIHHARGGDVIETRILHSDALRLTPPRLELDIADLFGPPEM